MQPKQASRVNVSRFTGLSSRVLFGLLLLPALLNCASAKTVIARETSDGGTSGAGSVWISVYPNQLAIATVSVPYSAHINALSGTAPYRFAFVNGTIPPGLYLNTTTGTVAGTPTTAGSFNFRVAISDYLNVDHNEVTIYMIVNPASATPVITVTVSPSSASIASAATQQFSAIVAHTSNTAVTWTASTGTISSSGMFTAPR